MRRSTTVFLTVALGLAACAPAPTPLPAFIVPTATTPPMTNTPAPVRYAIVEGSAGLVSDLPDIKAAAQVITLDAPVDPQDLGPRYDIVAGYGARENWTISPVAVHVALVVNTARPPLNEPTAANVIRRVIDTTGLVTALAVPGAQPVARQGLTPADARVALANAGLPDGFDVRLAFLPVPGARAVANALKALDIGAIVEPVTADAFGATLDAETPHLILIAWSSNAERQAWSARAGEANVIDLYTLPISYLAVDGLHITIGRGGFPIARR